MRMAVRKAGLILSLNLALAIGASVWIVVLQPELMMSDVLFETFSAIGTAGMVHGDYQGAVCGVENGAGAFDVLR